MKIAIIGDGGWGTALALLLNSYCHDVSIWGYSEEYLNEVRQRKENFKFLKGVPLPDSITLTSSPSAAVKDAECIVLAAPSKFFRGVCERFAGLIDDDKLVVSVTKGFDEECHSRMSIIAKSILKIKDVVVLSGPSHAEEVANLLPTCVVAACENSAKAEAVQQLFSGSAFRVYTGSDPLGAEIGGAVKNVIAVAVGVSDGMGFGDNSRSALIARGLAEMTRLGVAMGANAETFSGLSGIGDLVVTCTSKHSRNHSVGERLGKGETIDEIISSMQMVAEGVWNSHIVNDIAAGLGIDMPICSLVHQFCDEGIEPKLALKKLMTRSYKAEEST